MTRIPRIDSASIEGTLLDWHMSDEISHLKDEYEKKFDLLLQSNNLLKSRVADLEEENSSWKANNENVKRNCR